MASGPLGGEDSTGKQPCKETKVYTRKSFRGRKTNFIDAATKAKTIAVSGTVNDKGTDDGAVKPSDLVPEIVADVDRDTRREIVDIRLEGGASEDRAGRETVESRLEGRALEDRMGREMVDAHLEGSASEDRARREVVDTRLEGGASEDRAGREMVDTHLEVGASEDRAGRETVDTHLEVGASEDRAGRETVDSRLEGGASEDRAGRETVDSRLEGGVSEDRAGEECGGVGVGALSEVIVPGSDRQVRISLESKTKSELRGLKRKLVSELDTVRNLVKRIEDHVGMGQVGNKSVSVSEGIENANGVRRVELDVAPVGVHRESRHSNRLSVSLVENSHGVGDVVEKEKRTPKANQFYSNSDFLLAKDKFPPAESNKKAKTNGRKPGGGDVGGRFTAGSKFFKSCSALLEKLIKHKHGWVFNKPVDVEALNLHDYFDIIKHPMDLGTIKTRLLSNGYKSPKEFAEDVRLTFSNAMTYNPKGHDVHTMAEQLLKVFEDRWAIIESDYERDVRFATAYEASIPMPTTRSGPPHRPPSLDMRRVLDRSESMTYPVDPKPRPMDITPSGRSAAPKKPKAKDLHKRDMTYEEKQKLSSNLQNLPPEKLDSIVQIIKKRNSALCQHDDEIEVDIDSVDTETLWELDRFVTNYKKSLSKIKRKAELASQARAAVRDAQERNPAPVRQEVPNEARTDERNISSLQVAEGQNQVNDANRSSSSSSSSSDSDSSSSDSDSESSSASRSGGS